MVVTGQRLASEVGVDILRQGGNAVDAAVAVGYALAVVYPAAGNLGGGGFMTLRFADGRSTFLDFREHAPLAATATMYLDAQGNVVPGLSTDGYLSVGVPGSVAGPRDARSSDTAPCRATRSWRPRSSSREDGFALSPGDVALLDTGTDELRKDPAAAAIFLKPGGEPYRPGDRLVQQDLAGTLRAIAQDGSDAFYKGPIADKIVAASEAGRRHPAEGRPRAVQRPRAEAGRVQLPRLRRDLLAAAELGRGRSSARS